MLREVEHKLGIVDPTGESRLRKRDGEALAGESTLNRLEFTPVGANDASRYKKITVNLDRGQSLLVESSL